MTKKEQTTISKFMSLALRHEPQKVDIQLDEHGWANTEKLITGINNIGYTVTLEDIKKIVETNDKQRFKFNDDFTQIRANQGHSVKINVDLKEITPPDILYHGTSLSNLDSIQKNGIRSQSRLHVHLSSDKETAKQVGSRHGKPVILIINTKQMYMDKYNFYLSENKVWLTDKVPPKYIKNHIVV